MYVRPLRYNQPANALLLDIFNYTNKTSIEPWQVTFGLPVAVPDTAPNIVPVHVNDYDLRRPNDTTLTEIEMTATPESDWTGSHRMVYRREVIQDHFISVPFVVYAVETNDQVILDMLLQQYGLYLDADLVTVEFRPVDLNEVLFLDHMGSILDGGNCDYQPPVSHNVVITMKPEHPVFVGAINVYVREAVRFLDRDIKTTLEVHRYLGPGEHAKMPAEMILPNNRFVDDNFTMRGLKVDDLVGPWIVEKAKVITGDNWVFTQEQNVFNLYGAKVVYNGLNTGSIYINDPKVSNALIVQFSDEHCSNIRGQWIIGYYNADVWARRTRIDALPIQDQ